MEKLKYWGVPHQLTGNTFIYGRPGSGKSCKLLTVAQGLHSKGWKIWDLFGGKREEGPFWSFPNDDDKLWKMVEAETAHFKNEGPKQYRVKLLYPMFKNKLPNKLPHNPPNVINEVFTIPFRDLPDEMEQLISTVIGAMGSTSSRMWNKLINSTDKNSNLADIEEFFNKNSKSKNDRLYDSFIQPIIKGGLLSGDNCPNKLDLVEHAKDTETVTVLCLDYIPAKFKYFVMGYILKKLFNLAKTNKIHKKNFSLFREASLFMKVVDSDKSGEEATSIFRNIVTDIARYCRSGVFLGLDTQDSCLEENTLVMTKENNIETNKKIKNLSNEPILLSYNFDTKKYEWIKSKKIDTGFQEVYEIILDNGKKVIATQNHRFFKDNNQEIYVRDLKEGDDILVLDKKTGQYRLSEERKKFISEQTKKAMDNPIIKEKISNANRNRVCSQETKKKLSDNMKEGIKSGRIKNAFSPGEKHSKWNKGKKLSDSIRKNISIALKNSKKFNSIDNRNKISKKGLQRLSDNMKNNNPMHDPITIKKVSKSRKEQWKDDEQYKKNYINSLLRTKPNKQEQKIIELINKNNLKFQFVGNAKIWFTGSDNSRYNPDFIDKENKKIIEFFGDYWHKNTTERDSKRILTYKLKGYDVLIIKEKEMENINNVENKLINFVK